MNGFNKKTSQMRGLLYPGNQWGSNPRPLEPQSNALTNCAMATVLRATKV